MPQPDAAPSIRQLMKRAENTLKKGDGAVAIELLNQVLAINPNHVDALYTIGTIFHNVGRFADAQNYYERVLHTDPTYIESYLMLAKLLEEQNLGDQAIKIAHLATQMAPDNPKTHLELCTLLDHFNKAHAAMTHLEHVLPKFPKDAALLQLYCMTLKINDRLEEADIAYDKLTNQLRTSFAARVLYETYLPRLSRSAEEIDHVRTKFKTSLEMFIAQKQKIDIDTIRYQPIFQLAFHNRDNKELLQLYTRTLRSMDPSLNYTAPHCKAPHTIPEGRIRVGFVSAHMHRHSVGNCYRNVMIALAQHPDFEVVFFNLSTVMDDSIQQVIDAGDVVKRDAALLFGQQAGAGFAEAHGAAAAALHLAHEEHPDADQQQHREPGQHVMQQRIDVAFFRLGDHLHALIGQAADQRRVFWGVGLERAAIAEGAGDGAALDDDAADAAAIDLADEVRIGDLRGGRAAAAGLKEVEQHHQKQGDHHPECEITAEIAHFCLLSLAGWRPPVLSLWRPKACAPGHPIWLPPSCQHLGLKHNYNGVG